MPTTSFAMSDWRHYRRTPGWRIDKQWQSWLLDQGSLTQRLINASQGHFNVRVTRENWLVPSRSEAQQVGLKTRQVAWVREVNLCCYGQTWVRARSIIPPKTLRGPRKVLKQLGNRPLGAFLFKTRGMRRGPIEIGRDQDQWARRSVFYLQNHPVLVSEFFLPVIVSR